MIRLSSRPRRAAAASMARTSHGSSNRASVVATIFSSASESLARALVNAGSAARLAASRCPMNVRVATSSVAARLIAFAHHRIVTTSPRTTARRSGLSRICPGSTVSMAAPAMRTRAHIDVGLEGDAPEGSVRIGRRDQREERPAPDVLVVLERVRRAVCVQEHRITGGGAEAVLDDERRRTELGLGGEPQVPFALVAEPERDERTVVILEILPLRAAALLEVGLVGGQGERRAQRAAGAIRRRDQQRFEQQLAQLLRVARERHFLDPDPARAHLVGRRQRAADRVEQDGALAHELDEARDVQDAEHVDPPRRLALTQLPDGARHQADGSSRRRLTDLRQAAVHRLTQRRLPGIVEAVDVDVVGKERLVVAERRHLELRRQCQRPVDARGDRVLNRADRLVIQPGIDQREQVDLRIRADRAHQRGQHVLAPDGGRDAGAGLRRHGQ